MYLYPRHKKAASSVPTYTTVESEEARILARDKNCKDQIITYSFTIDASLTSVVTGDTTAVDACVAPVGFAVLAICTT